MRNNQKTSTRMRLLAWLMAMVMMCTSINVSVFAESIGYEDAAVEMQSVDESLVDVEEVEEAEVVSEVQETESSEIEDAYIEEETGMPVDDEGEETQIIDESGEEIYTDEMLDAANLESMADGEANAAESLVDIKQFGVRFADKDGYYFINDIHCAFQEKDEQGNKTNNYYAYLMPGEACQTTIPEEVVTESSTSGCSDHTYTWDKDVYIKLTMPTEYRITEAKWEENVLKLSVQSLWQIPILH